MNAFRRPEFDTMVIKSIALCLVAVFATLMSSCLGGSASKDDIVGEWAGPGDATLDFMQTGQFSARRLPGRLLLGPGYGGEVYAGIGHWTLGDGPAETDVILVFNAIADRQHGFRTSVMTSGSGASLRLFLWMREEGGARFEFVKRR
jgi:hypothetical protein